MSIPAAYAHPDDVDAVFDHPAVWVNGTAIQVIGVSWQMRGSFVVDRGYGGVDVHGVPPMVWSIAHGPFCTAQSAARCLGCGPSLCSLLSGVLYDGQSAAWCLDHYERMQRDDPTVDLSLSLSPRQLAAARVLWSDRLRGLVMGSGVLA
jgi:hypothetical protein